MLSPYCCNSIIHKLMHVLSRVFYLECESMYHGMYIPPNRFLKHSFDFRPLFPSNPHKNSWEKIHSNAKVFYAIAKSFENEIACCSYFRLRKCCRCIFCTLRRFQKSARKKSVQTKSLYGTGCTYSCFYGCVLPIPVHYTIRLGCRFLLFRLAITYSRSCCWAQPKFFGHVWRF